jgi:hypothetical protein
MSDADVDFFTRPTTQKKSAKNYENIVTDEILDRLKGVESSGDTYALNPKTKAGGAYQFTPEQTITMHKQGITFNPLIEKEARQAARTYLQQLVNRNEGDIRKALAQYGGFDKVDSTDYVNKVMGITTPKSLTAQLAQTNAPVVDEDVSFFQRVGPPPTQPKEIDLTKPAFVYPRAFGTRTGTFPEKQQVTGSRQPPSLEGMGGSLAAIGDVVAGAPSALLGLAGYGGLRLAGRTPEQAQETAQSTAGLIAQPIGKLTGTAGTPAYEQDVLTAPLRQLGQYTQTKAKEISQATGIPEQDVEFGLNAGMLAAPKIAKTVVPPVARAIGGVAETVGDVRGQMAQQFAAKQGQPQPTAQPAQVAPQFQSGGSAAVAHTNAVKSALSEARPELQASLAGKNPLEITPQELKAIEIHNKFAKVDPEFVPTEAQALQDVAKLSDEYNFKAKPGYEALRAKFEQRDPMLIKGFNNVKEEFAPQHSGVGQQGKANNILEDIKTNYVDVDNVKIKNAYNDLNDLNGNFAVDMQQASKNALAKIEASKRTNRIPKEIKDTLDAYAKGEYEGSGIDFENLRTDIASDVRKAQKASDGTQVRILNLIRDSFEELPMKGENAIQFKQKADIARSLFKNQKDLLNPDSPKYNKAYAMAFEDNRTPTERLTVPHPASEKFFDSFVTGNKATPADLSRMLELVGKDSPAHSELIAGITDHLKQKAGVIDDKGNVSQAALRRELNKLGPRLDLLAGPEVANRLRNIGDVAELSEHVRNRGGGSANVSQSTITSEASAAQEALKGLGKAALNLKTGGISGAVESYMQPIFKAKQERLASEAAQKAQQESINRMVSPNAGINTQPTRIELNNMLPNRP